MDFPASITGATQTGLTSPTYTTALDQSPDVNAKQAVITTLGGTQTGVTVHSVNSPFTVAFWRPRVLRMLGRANPLTGEITQIPTNTYKVITRKGVTPAANQTPRPCVIRTEIDVPAGSDTYDLINVKAALSAHIGLLTAKSAELGAVAGSGVI